MQAAAKVWAQAGATGVVLAGRHVEALEKVKREIEGIDETVKVLTVEADISSEESVKGLFEEVTKGFGRGADVLLNNAVYHEPVIGEMNVEEWWKAFVSSF